jgi:hypothetical protein
MEQENKSLALNSINVHKMSAALFDCFNFLIGITRNRTEFITSFDNECASAATKMFSDSRIQT